MPALPLRQCPPRPAPRSPGDDSPASLPPSPFSLASSCWGGGAGAGLKALGSREGEGGEGEQRGAASGAASQAPAATPPPSSRLRLVDNPLAAEATPKGGGGPAAVGGTLGLRGGGVC